MECKIPLKSLKRYNYRFGSWPTINNQCLIYKSILTLKKCMFNAV